MDDDEAMPVLGNVDREQRLRLAIAVTGALADSAHRGIEWINNTTWWRGRRSQMMHWLLDPDD